MDIHITSRWVRRGKCIIRESAFLPISASMIRNRGCQMSEKRRRRQRQRQRVGFFSAQEMPELPHNDRPPRKRMWFILQKARRTKSSSHVVTPILQRAVSDTNSLAMALLVAIIGQHVRSFLALVCLDPASFLVQTRSHVRPSRVIVASTIAPMQIEQADCMTGQDSVSMHASQSVSQPLYARGGHLCVQWEV